MSELEVRDWIDIIDREIENRRKDQHLIMSMIGSSIVISGVLLWFTYINFIQNHNLDYILGLLFIQNLCLYLILVKRNLYGITYLPTIRRIEKKLPIQKEDAESITNTKMMFVTLFLLILLIILNICEFLILKNYLYYFMTSSLIIFILGIIIWVIILLSNLLNSIVEIYEKLRYDVLSEKIIDVNIIRNKFLLIGGKPVEVVIINEKGEYEEF